MKILIDTHAFLWLLTDDPRLSQTARALFLDRTHDMNLSVASLWEIAIKISLGKLQLAEEWYDTLIREMQINTIHWLPVEPRHCVRLEHLPFHHRDPFDRMLIAQATVENLAILTGDRQMYAYTVQCIW